MEENEKKLYPINFNIVGGETAWGSETFQVADLGYVDTNAKGGWLEGNSLSDIMETYMERVVGDKVFYFYGRQFPITARLFVTKENTPVMVCPTDEVAEQRYDSLGKKKLWYIVDTKNSAKVYRGLNKDVSAGDLYMACEEGTLPNLLNGVEVKRGDALVIEPAQIHCAGAGLVVLEISEASGLDFAIWNWGQALGEDEPGIAEVLDFVDLKKYSDAVSELDGKTTEQARPEDRLLKKLASEPEFTATEIKLTEALQIKTEEFDSFLLYSCVRGEALIQLGEGGTFTVHAGESIVIPNEVEDFYLSPKAVDTLLIETMVQREAAVDAYIDPEADPDLNDGE